MSFFDTISRSFAQVNTDPGINTKEFLEATEGLIKMFDLFGSSAFSIVQSDMTGNVKKIRERYLTNETENSTLQSLVIGEKDEKKLTATEGLLWLNRGLSFTSKALRSSVSNSTEELSVSFTNAYGVTLKKFHGMMVRPIFTLAMKSCPYRKDFYEKLGGDSPRVRDQMEEWLSSLEKIVNTVDEFYKEGEYANKL